MAPSPTVSGSSEQSSLLENNGGGSLQQPFMGYDSGGSGNGGATAAGDPSPGEETMASSSSPAPLRKQRTTSEVERERRAAIASQAKVPKEPGHVLTGRALFIMSVATVFVYLSVGVFVYTTFAGMGFLDALYFCVVTLTTVGYGDLSAHNPSTKLFACFYILVGVALVAAFLGQLVEVFLDKQETLLLKLLKTNRDKAMGGSGKPSTSPNNKVETGGAGFFCLQRGGTNSGDDDFNEPTLRRLHVEVTMGILSFLLLVGVGTAVFKISGDMSVIDAFYLTVVSSSTVGYGDYYPSSRGTRLFAVFFLPFSTLLLGKVITDYTEMKASEQTKKRQKRILMATITTDEYRLMDADGDGHISRLEFLCRTLVRQEKVTQEDINEIQARFTALDIDGNGFIELNEVGAARDRDGDGFIAPHEL